MIPLDVQPITLCGAFVRLEPATFDHAESLAKYAEPELFQYFAGVRPQPQTPEAVKDFLTASKKDRLVFAVIDLSTGESIGTTSFMDIRREDLGLEIGSTWLGRKFHGTKVNPECKLLLLQHAFEQLGCMRIQLRTDMRNLKSRGAIEKLGAKQEGIFRQHVLMPDGFRRDTVFFSILDSEWPIIKERLQQRLKSD